MIWRWMCRRGWHWPWRKGIRPGLIPDHVLAPILDYRYCVRCGQQQVAWLNNDCGWQDLGT